MPSCIIEFITIAEYAPLWTEDRRFSKYMLHPNYVELMKVVNKDVEEGEEPVISSRYSVVMATAKRARQIIAGAKPLVPTTPQEKPLSIAVDELWKGQLQIIGDDEDDNIDEEEAIAKLQGSRKIQSISEDDLDENLDADAAGDEEAEEEEKSREEAEESDGSADDSEN